MVEVPPSASKQHLIGQLIFLNAVHIIGSATYRTFVFFRKFSSLYHLSHKSNKSIEIFVNMHSLLLKL